MNAEGAVAGMMVGLASTLTYIFLAMNGITLFAIQDTGAGFIGVPINLMICIIVSLVTAPPAQHIQDDVIDLRYPEQMTYKDGEVWMDEGIGK